MKERPCFANPLFAPAATSLSISSLRLLRLISLFLIPVTLLRDRERKRERKRKREEERREERGKERKGEDRIG
jgi:hypothetical protein